MREDTSIPFGEDIHLMVKAQKGDRQAYARLYERYAPTVRRYIAVRHGRAESREDLVQEVFTRVWEHRDGYRPGMKVCPYLLGFARNVTREHKTHACSEKAAGLGRFSQAADRPQMSHVSPPSQMELAEQTQAVQILLAKLPFRQRQAMELIYLTQVPIHEVAKLMRCSVGSLRMNVCRARQRIERLLDK